MPLAIRSTWLPVSDSRRPRWRRRRAGPGAGLAAPRASQVDVDDRAGRIATGATLPRSAAVNARGVRTTTRSRGRRRARGTGRAAAARRACASSSGRRPGAPRPPRAERAEQRERRRSPTGTAHASASPGARSQANASARGRSAGRSRPSTAPTHSAVSPAPPDLRVAARAEAVQHGDRPARIREPVHGAPRS